MLQVCTTCTSALDFRAYPDAPQAKPYHRDDFSHSSTELLKIGYENEVLVKKLTGISMQPPTWVKDAKK